MATLFNGKLVYPPSEAIPQVKLIYGSCAVLALYAWLSPLVEAFVKLREVLSSTLACILESDPIPNLGAVHSQRAIVVEHEPVKA